MRFGSFIKKLTAAPAVTALGVALAANSAIAQYDAARQGPPAGHHRQAPPAQTPTGTIQALFMSSNQRMFGARRSHYVDADGNNVVIPAGYCGPPVAGGGYVGQPCDTASCGPAYGGAMHPHHMADPYSFNGPMPMGAGGTAPPVGYDLANDVGIEGYLVDQRGPHYFDLRAEAVWLKPDETFGRDIAFTSLNVTDENIVLSSGQLDYDFEPGFRVIGRIDVGALSVFEFGYMGIFDWESSASFTDPNPIDPFTGNLFSLFSEFGTNPPTVTNPGGPMPETERSIFQGISIESELQTAELTFRRYWLGYIPRVSGTILAGFRYTNLKEDFAFLTIGEAAQVYDVHADNNLAGFQTGGDIWIGLMQGVRLGAEGKVGIYNNHYQLRSRITTDPLGTTPPTLSEKFKDDELAFISEGSIDLVIDILPSLSLRGGYETLYLDSLVLAGDNFNTASPFGLPGQAPRIPFVDDNGDRFYHGFHAGVELIW